MGIFGFFKGKGKSQPDLPVNKENLSTTQQALEVGPTPEDDRLKKIETLKERYEKVKQSLDGGVSPQNLNPVLKQQILKTAYEYAKQFGDTGAYFDEEAGKDCRVWDINGIMFGITIIEMPLFEDSHQGEAMIMVSNRPPGKRDADYAVLKWGCDNIILSDTTLLLHPRSLLRDDIQIIPDAVGGKWIHDLFGMYISRLEEDW